MPTTIKTLILPWFWGTGKDEAEAAMTADWIDEEWLAFAIQPAKALAFAAAVADGKGCNIITGNKRYF